MAEGLQLFDANGQMTLDLTDSITRYLRTEFYQAQLGNYQELKFIKLAPKRDQSKIWCLTRMEKVTNYFGVERGPLPAFNVYIGSKEDINKMDAPIEWKQRRTQYMDNESVYLILSSEIVQTQFAPDNSSIYIDIGMF